jgi:hypothetical protein
MPTLSQSDRVRYLVEVNEWKRYAANMLDFRENWPDGVWESFGQMTNHLMVAAMRLAPTLDFSALTELVDIRTAKERPTAELYLRVVKSGEILDAAQSKRDSARFRKKAAKDDERRGRPKEGFSDEQREMIRLYERQPEGEKDYGAIAKAIGKHVKHGDVKNAIGRWNASKKAGEMPSRRPIN